MQLYTSLGVIDTEIEKTIRSRTGTNNVNVSNLIPWIRVASAVKDGMVLESTNSSNTFKTEYGQSGESGKIGRNFKGVEVYAPGTDRSFRPSPVIESLSVENGNQGLSRKSKFQITCFTLAQADELAKYFYEPGYTVLVEWGWNIRDSVEHRANLKDGGAQAIADYNKYKHIFEKRNLSKGTYDGFMGYITGGGFSNGDNDTYVMDVELTTIGEIPLYLQIQKAGNFTNPEEHKEESKTGLIYDLDAISAESDIGKSLFMQMVNKLPPEKQTESVKRLLTDTVGDVNGNPWTEQYNYVNMDSLVPEILSKKIEDGALPIKEQNVKIPKGLEIISTSGYIRAELAFKILNSYIVDLEPDKNNTKGQYSFIINTNDTLLRAHPYMFSTDGSKVFIPNTKHPSFNIDRVIKTTQQTPAEFVGKSDGVSFKIIDQCPWPKSDKPKYAFPSTIPIGPGTGDIKIRTYPELGTAPKQADAETFGYLRNLYINFDWFLDIITRPNYVAKDIYYDLLNGISMAVNSHWEFELLEQSTDDENRTIHMGVVDTTFMGKVNIQSKDGETSIGGNFKIPLFSTKGTNTPFITSNLDMNIPAVMRNSILGKRSVAGLSFEHQTDGVTLEDKSYQRFFSNEPDPVMVILNTIKPNTGETTGVYGPWYTNIKASPNPANTQTTSTDEIREQNLTLFLKLATIVPTIQDRRKANLEDIDVSSVLMVVAWKDTAFLKYVEQYAKKLAKTETSKSEGTRTVTNPAILGIEFSFDILGVSGLKVGDLFQIQDIPGQFKNGIFQIFTTSHSLSSGMWLTSVTARMRNM